MRISGSNVYQDHTNVLYIERNPEKKEDWISIFQHDHCPAIFNGGRSTKNFISSDFLYGDSDDGFSIIEFCELFQEYYFILYTSKSHQKEKSHKNKPPSPPCDRFHFLFPQEEAYTDAETLTRDLQYMQNQYPWRDPSATDAARFLYGFKGTEVIINNGIYYKQKPFGKETKEATQGDLSIVSDGNWLSEDVKESLESNHIFNEEENRKEAMKILKKLADKNRWPDNNTWMALRGALVREGFTLDDFVELSWPGANCAEEWARIDTTRGGATGWSIIKWCRELEPEAFTAEWFAKRKEVVSTQKIEAHVETAKVKGYPKTDQKMPKELWREDHCKMKKVENEDGSVRWEITGPKATLENFIIMIRYYGLEIREDLMRHKTVNCVKNEPEDTSGKCNNAFMEKLRTISVLNDFPAGSDSLSSMHTAVGHMNRYHPVHEWLDTGDAWDRVKRLDDVINLFTEKPGYNPILKHEILTKWFVSGMAALYEPNFKTRGVLVLQGDQGIGKTSILQSLFPSFAFSAGASYISGNKDSLEHLTSFWCSELAELEGIFNKTDISAMKAFISNDKDVIRFPYEKRIEEMERRSFFCGSVNDEAFLKDKTGNTRFWVIPVKALNYKHKINIRQFWLEIREIYRAGAKWWLDPSVERLLNDSNIKHMGEVPLMQSIMTHYDLDAPPTRILTCTQILVEMGRRETDIKRWELTELSDVFKSLGKDKVRQKKTGARGYAVPELKDDNKIREEDRLDYLAAVRQEDKDDPIPF